MKSDVFPLSTFQSITPKCQVAHTHSTTLLDNRCVANPIGNPLLWLQWYYFHICLSMEGRFVLLIHGELQTLRGLLITSKLLQVDRVNVHVSARVSARVADNEGDTAVRRSEDVSVMQNHFNCKTRLKDLTRFHLFCFLLGAYWEDLHVFSPSKMTGCSFMLCKEY